MFHYDSSQTDVSTPAPAPKYSKRLIRIFCPKCNEEFPLKIRLLFCTACGGHVNETWEDVPVGVI